MDRASYNMAIITQQDATEYGLFKSVNCSTCFGWYLHPPSGAHNTVSTVSGIGETVTATCRERGWMGTEFSSSHVPYQPKHVKQFADINQLYIYLLISTNLMH